jgi:hypothetical protein
MKLFFQKVVGEKGEVGYIVGNKAEPLFALSIRKEERVCSIIKRGNGEKSTVVDLNFENLDVLLEVVEKMASSSEEKVSGYRITFFGENGCLVKPKDESGILLGRAYGNEIREVELSREELAAIVNLLNKEYDAEISLTNGDFIVARNKGKPN